MKTRVAINGLGRIGRAIVRIWAQQKKEGTQTVEIVALNSPGSIADYVRLLKYDSCHGRLEAQIEHDEHSITIDGHKISFFRERNPADIPWSQSEAQIVIDGTGIFRDKESLSQHLGGSVQKVLLCAPGKDVDRTIVYGVNHQDYQKSDVVISNASCTTNCLAPVVKVLEDTFGIESGIMTTVHSYTLDQSLLDRSHKKDARRSRAAALSMIPTSTGAAKAIGEVIPSLRGKLDGHAVRVPTPNVSLVDLSVKLKKNCTLETLNGALENAAQENLSGILATESEPLVSIDFNGRRESSIVDLALNKVINENHCKIVSWYDNEMGFSARVLDLATYVGETL